MANAARKSAAPAPAARFASIVSALAASAPAAAAPPPAAAPTPVADTPPASAYESALASPEDSETVARVATRAVLARARAARANPVSAARSEPLFKVRFAGVADRYSDTVRIAGLSFDHGRRAIVALGSDGKTRLCLVDRLPSLEVGRGLWTQLATAANEGKDVQFIAAGGFSPDTWFYAINEMTDE
jgi:hypothetical protein